MKVEQQAGQLLFTVTIFSYSVVMLSIKNISASGVTHNNLRPAPNYRVLPEIIYGLYNLWVLPPGKINYHHHLFITPDGSTSQ